MNFNHLKTITMKKMLLNLIVTCLTFTLNATETDLKSLLIANEWELNTSETLLCNDPSIKESKNIIHDEIFNPYLILKPLNSQLDIKSILTSKDWKLDIEAMKFDLILKMSSLPEMEVMNDEEKEIVTKSVLISMEGIRYHFEKDNTLEYKIILKGETQYETKGTFSVDNEKNQLITNTDDEPNKLYQIISVEENKVVLKVTDTNVDFVLIPVNKT